MNLKEFSENTNVGNDLESEKNFEKEKVSKDKKGEVKKDIKNNFEEIRNTDEFKQIENDYGDAVRDFIANYSEKSEPELLSEMMRLIAEKKREGTFDAEKIKEMANSVAPLLTPEQREKMYSYMSFLD